VARFLVTYHGGSPPADPEQAAQMHAAFEGWLAQAGEAVVDPGAPVRSLTQVATGTPAPAVSLGGYSVIEAPSVERAEEVLRAHPFVARGGTLQLHEAIAV